MSEQEPKLPDGQPPKPDWFAAPFRRLVQLVGLGIIVFAVVDPAGNDTPTFLIGAALIAGPESISKFRG